MPRQKSSHSWDMMLPELLGRCFSLLDEKERCQVIPLVSKAFHNGHLSLLPQPTVLEIDKPLSHSRVLWFLRISSRVEHLLITVPETGDCCLLELLQSAQAPHLRKLEVHGDWTRSGPKPPVVLLTTLCRFRLRELSLRYWDVTEDEGLHGFHGLSSLTSLTSLHLGWKGFYRLSAEQAECLWTALASLTALRVLNFYPGDECWFDGWCDDTWSRPFHYQGMSTLTQISDLLLYNYGLNHAFGDIFNVSQTSFWALTQLRSLIMEEYGTSECVMPISALTQLEVLWLDAGHDSFRCEEDPTDGPPLDLSPFCHLTSLWLNDWKEWALTDCIPISMPALANLRHLALREMELTYLPDDLASALKSLTALDLHENKFEKLPESVTKISGLILLDLSLNKSLQLSAEDVDILESLPAFCGLNIQECQPITGLPDISAAIVKRMCHGFEGMPSIRRILQVHNVP